MKKIYSLFLFLVSLSCAYAGQEMIVRPGNNTNKSMELVAYASAEQSGVQSAYSPGTALSGAALNMVAQKGIHAVLSTLKQPTIVIIGTSAALVLSLSEYNSLNFYDMVPAMLGSSTMSTGLSSIGKGIAYAVGEGVASDLIALHNVGSVQKMLPTIMHGLTMTGVGFYLWNINLEPFNMENALMTSAISGAVLTALTSFSHTAYAQQIKDYFSRKFKGFNDKLGTIGEVVGVVTLTGAGIAAAAYERRNAQSAVEALGSYALNVAKQTAGLVAQNIAPIAKNLAEAVVTNAGWLTGYNWLTNAFRDCK